MIVEDRREKERIDAKNALEEYVYMLRDKLDGELSQFVEENEKAKLGKELGFIENWLYEDGSEENRQAYSDRLQNLKVSYCFITSDDYGKGKFNQFLLKL
jgi:molecular chaperone DnaK (HSP70)